MLGQADALGFGEDAVWIDLSLESGQKAFAARLRACGAIGRAGPRNVCPNTAALSWSTDRRDSFSPHGCFGSGHMHRTLLTLDAAGSVGGIP
jgi:hypothetical protein